MDNRKKRRHSKVNKLTRHGHAVGGHCSRTYRIWRCMVGRCHNPKNIGFKYYGARGIVVTERWRAFVNFLNDMGDCPPGMTLDRIDNCGNYEPSNCRWASQRDQQRNRTNNVKYTYSGRTFCIREWEDYLGMNNGTLWARLKLGWSLERAITTPVRSRRARSHI